MDGGDIAAGYSMLTGFATKTIRLDLLGKLDVTYFAIAKVQAYSRIGVINLPYYVNFLLPFSGINKETFQSAMPSKSQVLSCTQALLYLAQHCSFDR